MLNRFDVVVVGGGTAGCAVAARLAGSGRKVLVLEAGPDYGHASSGRWPADLLSAATIPASHDWGYGGTGAGGQRLEFERCRAIGGCSTHNGATQNVGWGGDYDRWAASGLTGWSALDLEPFFELASKALSLRNYSDEQLQPFQTAFVAAASDQGLETRNDFLSLDGGAGVGYSAVSITDDGTRFNSAFAYLDDLRESGKLTVLGDVEVTGIRLEQGRAVGVYVNTPGPATGEPALVYADSVVVSAGAYGSPELLLKSGIGPAGDLARAAVAVQCDLPGVGKGLQDHPSLQLEYGGTPELASALAEFGKRQWLPDEQAIAKVKSPEAGDAPFDLHIYPWTERDSASPHGWRCVIPIGLVKPRSRGALTLKLVDGRLTTEVNHAYLADPRDMSAVRYGMEWAQEIIDGGLSEFSRYLGPRLNPIVGLTTDWIAANHRHYWHPVGTCRMGKPDAGGVVDHRGAVHGIENLYVADASVFPDIPRGTTALPTTVVGERIASFLLEDN
ncbi:GMC family oxidoreductase [Mycobacterium sp. CBMA247]|nr:GMC family oxidoreductase [Mycolicibacterium sp. CBMA 329]MUL87405.1 GMC family oxidoreductase [Mycolicibacterium sp. CBMA 331]MUL99729.1 GMC family oxidoreductase [Mycolicibacterium sp. CBMA 334]MUM37702.1 GMC family oxidoreductase [Mycolicibacterium sp. CBMA 247]MUM43470.1 GMC family oxidoreductase [Mycolicibacterium sp. CBMA 294]